MVKKNWKKRKLNELLITNFDGVWGPEAEGDNGFSVIRSTNMRGGKLSFENISRRQIPEKTVAQKKLITGDILVNKSSGSSHLVGASVLFKGNTNTNYLCSNFIRCIRPNLDLILYEYLYYYLQSPMFRGQVFGAQRTTSGLRNLKIKEYLEGLVLYPGRNEQRRIVARIKECLDRVDDIRRLREELQQESENLFRGARREYFGSSQKLKTNWTEVRLEEKADVIYGISAAIAKNKDPSLGPPIVRMANISLDGHLNLSDLRYQPIPKGSEEHYLLKPGDLLLNWRSGSSSHVGKTAIFNEKGEYTCASFILRIRAKENITNNRYLRHILNFMRAEGIFEARARMQINSKLNAKEFALFPIRFPQSIEEQEEIADNLDRIELISREINQKSKNINDEISYLIQAILQKAFSGKL